MASTSEVGHARNVTNFQALIAFCTSYGAAYAPTNAAIKLAGLNAALTAANTAMSNVTTLLAPWKVAVNNRNDAFLPLSKLMTRVNNTFAASGTPASAQLDVQGIVRRIQGRRADGSSTGGSVTGPGGVVVDGVSASQMSYVQRVANLSSLITMLSGYASYNPAEVPLKVASLTTLKTSLDGLTTAEINAYTPLSNARISRNQILYADDAGLVDLSKAVKKYIKGAFGGSSPQYNQVKALEFRVIARD